MSRWIFIPCLLPALGLPACATQSFEQMTLEYHSAGGASYEAVHPGELYIVYLHERSSSPGNYATNTPQLRARAADVLLRSKARCASTRVSDEVPFDNQVHPKRWARGTWWRLLVRCET